MPDDRSVVSALAEHDAAGGRGVEIPGGRVLGQGHAVRGRDGDIAFHRQLVGQRHVGDGEQFAPAEGVGRGAERAAVADLEQAAGLDHAVRDGVGTVEDRPSRLKVQVRRNIQRPRQAFEQRRAGRVQGEGVGIAQGVERDGVRTRHRDGCVRAQAWRTRRPVAPDGPAPADPNIPVCRGHPLAPFRRTSPSIGSHSTLCAKRSTADERASTPGDCSYAVEKLNLRLRLHLQTGASSREFRRRFTGAGGSPRQEAAG